MLKINVLFLELQEFWGPRNIIFSEYKKEIRNFVTEIFETCKVQYRNFLQGKISLKIFLGICHAD